MGALIPVILAFDRLNKGKGAGKIKKRNVNTIIKI